MFMGGLANLLFPRQVLSICEAYERLFPWGSRGMFADAGEKFYRVSGAIFIFLSIVGFVLQRVK